MRVRQAVALLLPLPCLCEERFFVYDWPSVASTFGAARDRGEITAHYANGGAGAVVNASAGTYATDQYQLFLLMHGRAVQDARRTRNASEASTFLIPYDFANDAAYYRVSPKDGRTKQFDLRRCRQAGAVLRLLGELPYFGRRGGADHLLVVGMNYAMDTYLLKPRCRALLEACSNCTKLSIDDYSFLYPDGGKGDPVARSKGDNWVAVPFPSNFHWTRAVSRPFPWEGADRPLLVSYVGSTDSYWAHAKSMRRWLVSACARHPDECVHRAYSKGRDAHAERDVHRELSQRSVFCLQPLGDLHTRKGLFDSLLHGCVPVVFDPLSASAMYVAHWSERLWRSVAVQLEYAPDVDPVAQLRVLGSNASALQERQRLIRRHVFSLQYSLSPYVRGSSWPLDETGAPLGDAYDLGMDLALGAHSGRRTLRRTATVPECWGGGVLVDNSCTAARAPG